MNIIAAADKNWAIGYKGGLLVSIPSDMKFFRETTSGKVIVMGRKTLESFPGGKPLRNRTNIVLTSDKNFEAKGACIVHSLEELFEELKKYDTDDIFVVGGGSVYRQLLPYCDRAYITKVNYEFQADTFLPNLDTDEQWELAETSGERTCFDIEYYFTRYERRKRQ